MDSRPNHGERLRSSRIAKDAPDDVTPPRLSDRAIAYFTVVGGDPANPDPAGHPGLAAGDDVGSRAPRAYQHPGGMALVGNMLAMALENPRRAGAVPRTQIMFFDVSDPAAPVFTSQFTPVDGAGEVPASVGVVAVTPLPGGRYLMMATGGAHNSTWTFYRSTLSERAQADGADVATLIALLQQVVLALSV
jgi:hypothetical protein